MAEAAIPPGVVTETGELGAPTGTIAVICVGETTVKDVAFKPPNCTCVVPIKPVPVIVIIDPAAAIMGEIAVTVGGAKNEYTPSTAVPPGVVTLTLPVAPPAATTAVICVADTNANDAAGTPPKLTPVTPVKFVPLIVIVAPANEPVGVKFVMVGGAWLMVMLKGAALNVPAPLLACTVIGPNVPPTLGVPAISPVAAFSVKPIGSVPATTL